MLDHTPQELRDAIAWLVSGNTGTSSQAIFSVMTGTPFPRTGLAVPRDAGDFHRCHLLLERFPRWRDHLYLVAERFPEWTPLIPVWPDLTALYNGRRHAALTVTLQSLLPACYRAGGWEQSHPGVWTRKEAP